MMNQDDWTRLQNLFHQACALPPEKRLAFAQLHASDQPDVLRELQAMLESEASATQAVRKPLREIGTHLATEALADIPAGTRLGPWQVDRLIGKGGMGKVYLGHRADGTYERQVAIKVMGAQLHHREGRDYFQFERRMLAHMHHPAIAQIHDAGSDDQGRLYLVMEYVPGTSLTRWCQEHDLDLRERVKLLQRVAEGVQHAHQKGVIHRDLKPGNILVSQADGQTMPKIIDFGIATQTRPTDDSPSQAAGTPGYMSPEQAMANSDIDSRSDVYSLGAMLFELIAGQRPDGTSSSITENSLSKPLRPSDRIDTLPPEEFSSLAERLRLRPRQLKRALRDDLDWVVTRATQPDRNLRYPSAAAFAEDLQRWLDDNPLQAAPDRRLYRLRKFVNRNRGGVLISLTLLLAILAGLIGTTVGWHRAERAIQREQATNKFLGEILTSVDPSMSFDLDQTLMRRVLQNASDRVQAMLSTQPEARANIEMILAYTYRNLGDSKRAFEHVQSSLQTATSKLGQHSLAAMIATMEMGSLLSESGKLQEAETLMRESLPAAYALSRTDPVLGPRMESRLGWNLLNQGRAKEALPLLESSYRMMRQRVGDDHQRSVDAGQFYAVGLSRNNRLKEAIALTETLTQQQVRLLGEDHPQSLAMRNSLASFYSADEQFQASQAELRAILKALGDQHGSATRMRHVVQFNLAASLLDSGTPESLQEAGPLFQEAVNAQREQGGADHPQTILMRAKHLEWLVKTGHQTEARETLQAVATSGRKVFGANAPQAMNLLVRLAEHAVALGDVEDAQRLAEEASALQTTSAPDEGELQERLRKLQEDIQARQQSTP